MAKKLKTGTAYRVTESFRTPVLDGHEIGGVWSEHASVPLDPGDEFTIVGVDPPRKHGLRAGLGTGWHIAEMKHNLRFNVGTVADFIWKGKFYFSPEFHGTKVEEVK